ncbi:hypothetical protein B0H11DRAFT_1755802, partial [Mycena galericulata]
RLHPWLNGYAPSPTFYFDLAPPQFAPQCLVNGNRVLLSPQDMGELAFHPPIAALRIVHPRMPFWPVDLVLPAELATQASRPISLGDILVSLHRTMHQRISAADWYALPAGEVNAVTETFTHRCRMEAIRSAVMPAQLRDREIMERRNGVKRIDFLLRKTVLKGLVKATEDHDGCVRMVTA